MIFLKKVLKCIDYFTSTRKNVFLVSMKYTKIFLKVTN